jgi:hypothetical protein
MIQPYTKEMIMFYSVTLSGDYNGDCTGEGKGKVK